MWSSYRDNEVETRETKNISGVEGKRSGGWGLTLRTLRARREPIESESISMRLLRSWGEEEDGRGERSEGRTESEVRCCSLLRPAGMSERRRLLS